MATVNTSWSFQYREGFNMPKLKTVMLKELRQKRKAAGLVEFKYWVMPEDRESLRRVCEGLEAARELKGG